MYKKTGIGSWPEDERPREKLFLYGEHRLSNTELVAILLGSGSAGEDAVALARRIWLRFGGFRKMGHTDPRDWTEFKGLGKAKLARLKAAIEIGRRFAEKEQPLRKTKITGPRDIMTILMPRLRDLKKEVVKVVFLDGGNQVIDIVEITEGTPNQAHPFIREIVCRGLQSFSAGLVAVHNHPSGQTQPSREDREFTAKLKSACNLVGITLVDHLIIGDGRYFSFSEAHLV